MYFSSNKISFFISGIILFVGLFLIPIYIQEAPTHSRVFDPELGWAPKESPQVCVGSRCDVIQKDTNHLLYIGDSVGFGAGLKKEHTASYKLNKYLKKLQVLNLSVSGWVGYRSILFIPKKSFTLH